MRLAETGLPAARLAIEIPESLLGESLPIASEALTGIRALGVGLHLDDFGAKYSSLSRIRDFKLDALKIDRTFIANDDPANRAILRAVISLAHALKFKTVAEGVETVEQGLRDRQDTGCDFVQGYLIARPLAPKQAEHFMAGATSGPWTHPPEPARSTDLRENSSQPGRAQETSATAR